MDTFSFSSEKLRDIQSLILHFDRVKVQLMDNKQLNLIPFHDTYFLITKSVFSKLGTGFFENDDNMISFVLSFAKFYFDALDQYFKGEVVINEGAKTALSSNKISSLLPVGIISVKGDFSKGDIIRITDENGLKIGLGKAEYPASLVKEKIGLKNQKPFIHYDYLYLFQNG